MSDLLHTVTGRTANLEGQGFLRALVRELKDFFQADAALVVDFVGDVLAASAPDGGAGEGHELDVPIPRPDGSDAGRISIRAAKPIEPSDDDREGLDVLAVRAGVEIERARREEALMRIAQAAEEERRRIGRTLHDGPQQRLVAIGHFLDVARKRLGDAAPDVAPLLEHASDDAREAGRELRELSRGLNPASLTERGLGVALTTLAGNSPLPVQLDAVPEGRLPDPVETALYYLVAEALANAAKHADAAEVRVRIEERGESIVAELTGSGLSAQGDRIAALGGTVTIGETRLTASIPREPWIR